MKQKTFILVTVFALVALLAIAGASFARAQGTCIYGCVTPPAEDWKPVVAGQTLQFSTGSITFTATIANCSMDVEAGQEDHSLFVYGKGTGCGPKVSIPALVCVAAPLDVLTLYMTDSQGNSGPITGFRDGKLLCANVWIPSEGASFGLSRK